MPKELLLALLKAVMQAAPEHRTYQAARACEYAMKIFEDYDEEENKGSHGG